MRIERLDTSNLREGIICRHGKAGVDAIYDQMGAWVDGNLVRGQVARTDDGEVAGFVIYYPIENAPMDVDGEGVYLIQCIYVMPEHQKSGLGKALFEASIADAQANGATGLAVEGFAGRMRDGFEYKPGAFFAHMGMTPTDKRGQGTLYYVGFKDEEQAGLPRYLEPNFKPQASTSRRIKVDILDCRGCFTAVHNRNLIEAVLEQAGKEKFEVEVHDQSNREAVVDKGMSTGVFIDGKLTFFDGPISETDVWNAIEVAEEARKNATDR